MKVVRHKTVREFLDGAGSWLARAEAENNLILGVCSDLLAHPERYEEQYESEPYLITVEGEGGIAGAALMTPPRKLVITRSPDSAIRALARYLVRTAAPVLGVTGPSREAKVFAASWSDQTGKPSRMDMSQRIYQCDRVVQPAASPGHLRPGVQAEEALLVRWYRQFCRELELEEENHRLLVHHKIADGRLYVWENGRTVSMAGCVGETVNGARLGPVYTPPNLRRRGYATSCVAALTRLLLDSGNAYCFLYADLANPTSNGIYRQIGYRPVCDSQIWRFD